MDKLIVKNGIVFDPLNNVNGEKKDVLIEDGIIVEKFSTESDVKEIDANNKTVIPAALDIHVHIASQQVNWARLLGSNNKEFQEYWRGLTLKKIAKDYISNGYVFILEANTFPSLAKQTIFNFKSLPVLDKAMLLNVSNLWPLELEYQRGKIEDMGIFLADLLNKTKSYGFKAYNPFEAEDWNFKLLREDLTNKGRLYNFSALDVYENLTKANERLKLPHSLHAHIEGYETEQGKKNLKQVLEKIDSLDLNPTPDNSLNSTRSQIFHLAHASMYNTDGDNRELIDFVNNSTKIDLDISFVGFNPINPLTTSDKRLINNEVTKSPTESTNNLIHSAVESEGDFYVSLRKLSKKNKQHCMMWLNSINLALDIKNKWQIQFSLNFPNYGDVKSVPDIATWLLSSKARNKFMEGMSLDGIPNSFQADSSSELTFNDFVIITRSSPAKSLGLGNIKGNLGIGADGDLNILDVNITELDCSKDYLELKKSLSKIDYVVKSGITIKNKDKVRLGLDGKIYWANREIENREKIYILSKKNEFYTKYYSVYYDSYKVSVEDSLLRQF